MMTLHTGFPSLTSVNPDAADAAAPISAERVTSARRSKPFMRNNLLKHLFQFRSVTRVTMMVQAASELASRTLVTQIIRDAHFAGRSVSVRRRIAADGL